MMIGVINMAKLSNKLNKSLVVVLLFTIYIGIVTIASNGFLTNYGGYNYFAIVSGFTCIIFSILLLNRFIIGYHGLLIALISMLIILPITAHKLEAGDPLVWLLVILTDPLGLILLAAIIFLNISYFYYYKNCRQASNPESRP